MSADDLFGKEVPQGSDSLFSDEDSGERQLKFVMDSAIDEKPERAARALEIQQKTGVPKKFIDDNYDELDRTARQSDFDAKQYTKSNPKVADWLLKNPDYAPLIRDDNDSMSSLEGILRVAENTVRAVGAAPSRAGSGLWGVAQAGAEVVGADHLAGFFSEQRTGAAQIAQGIRGNQEGAGFVEKAALSGIESAATSLLMLPASIMTGSPTPMLAGLSAQAGGEAYGQARDKGVPVPTSLGYGASQAVIEYATELLPASKLLGDLIGDSGFIKTITNQLISEVPREQVATILQDLNEWAIINPEEPFSSYLEERPSAFAQTLIATIVGTSAQTAVAHGGKKLVDHVQKRSAENMAKVQEDFFTALGENTTNSKLYEKLPDSYQQIIKDLTKDGPVENVYAPVEFFQSHFQDQELDPRKLATELGIERQYDEAVNTGGKIAIPLDVYAKNLAPTEHNAVFAKELSFGPDQMSSRETEDFLKEAEEQEPDTDTFGDSLEQAMTPIRDQLKVIYPTDVADKNAAVIEARLRSRATRLGIDPQELMKQRPLEITEGGTETGSVLNQFAEYKALTSGQEVDGREVINADNIPNMGSIGASVDNPEVLSGVREIQMTEFTLTGRHYSVKGQKRIDDLAEQIGQSKQITPLIVVRDAEGFYVLEGATRAEALFKLGAKSFPAKVVLDLDSLNKEQDGGNELMQAQKQTETPEFSKWFGESKVVDDNGKPLVVYHGTDKSFTKFNPKKATMGGIHWFTSDKGAVEAGEVGAQGKGKILELYASLKNPAGWNEYNKYGLGELKSLGYDGAILPESDGTFTGFFFDPTQVKSATRNLGTFDPNDPNILKQEGKDVKRGSISVSPNGDVIRLFQAKNLSTLLHELSHRWLFEMQDDAALPNAPQQIKDDLAATLKYLGVESVEELDITKLPKGTAAYKKAVAANEKFAESGEAYLMEGKAPSSALRRVFAQIRAWLVAVYKALKQGRLNAELTDEIRAVFDRLLATDEEIKAARAEANVVPIFTTADDAGMTDAEFSAFRKVIEDANREAQEELDSKVMREYKKTLTDLWKEEKTKVQSEVEAELDTVLIYAASAKMKANGIKISKDSIKNIGIVSNIHSSLVAKDGITPDMAAELLGFTSGEALIRDLSTAEPRDSRVRRETNIRMDQKFGNMIADGSVMEEAQKAVMGDGRAKTIEAEIKALNKKAREVEPFVKAKDKAKKEEARAGRDLYKALVPKLADVREHAASVIARKPIRELKPMQYYNAARIASREAVNDVRKGDYLMAAYNKGRELLNLELYRATLKAQELIEDGNQKLQKVFVSDIKQSKSRNMDMVNAARAILASHGLGKTDASPTTYLDKMRQYEPEVYENLRPIFEPAIASMKPFKEMTVEEYVGMRDAVFALIKTSRRSKQMEIDGKLIERDEAIANLVNRMMDLDKGKSKELRSTLDDLQKTKIGLLSAKAALRRVESWVTAMDGGPNGAFRKYIWNPVSDAVNQYRDKKREVVSRYLEIVQEVAHTIKPGDIEAPELGFKFRGKNELLHALLHTGNESNKAKLTLGYDWATKNEDGSLNTGKLPDGRAGWDAFEKRMRDKGVLTKADYDFAQNVWDMMDGMKPTLQEAHHRMYGYYFNEVTANEFTNEFGTYRGGYVPAKVDVNVVQEAEQRKDAEEIVQGQNSFAFPTSGKGATMSRVDGYARPLQLDMRTIPAHIDWAMRFAYLEPSVKDVARVVLDKEFAKSLNGIDPTTINHMLVPWLQRTAQQVTSTRGMNKWVDKFWTGVRSRSGMQVMVLNVINTLQQFTGLTIAFTRVKPSNIRSAFWAYMTKHKEFSEEISEKSSFMRNRVFTSHNEVMQTIDDLLLNPSKYEKAKDFATKHGYFMQQATQGFVDQIVWHASYSESLSKGQDDKDSVRHADSVVRETQGSFAPEDISRFEAGTPFVRAFSMFYNYFNMQANLLGTEAAKVASSELGLRKGAGRALYVYTFAFMIPAYVGGAIIRAVVAGGLDEDDDDEYMDDLIRLFFSSQFEAATATVPIAGQLLNTAVSQWNNKWYDDKITVSPAVSAVESAVRAPYSVYKSIVEEGNEKRAVKDTLSLIGMITGLPAGALGRPLGYLADVHQGKANPENALDVTRGLISGQDVNR